MTYYPVIIPTLNRYEHFRRCVESLARNTHADKTELVIGLDYPPSEKYEKGYKQIKEYIPSIAGFKKVTVFERKENYGAGRNYRELEKYAFEHYDAVISTEDDNEFSPCFLDFMSKAFERYKRDERISCICGYNDESQYDVSDSNIIFIPSGGAWGMGQWKSKQYMLDFDDHYAENTLKSWKKSWKIFHTRPAVLQMLMAMNQNKGRWGDVVYCCRNILEGRYQVRPRISMVRNWGHDGSGLHCGKNNIYERQQIQTAATFNIDSVYVGVDNIPTNKRYFNHLSPSRFKAYLQIVYIAISYILYRLRIISHD